MNKDIACEICGGKDYRKEAGFYYCTECQTQSQDVKELLFEVPESSATNVRGKRIGKKKESSKKGQITSWECYNYVMLGLVNEMIELGADENLKTTVQVLWLKYLKENEVISENNNKLPKLPAFNCSIDSEIVYGRVKPARKRKRKSDSETSLSEDDVSSMDFFKMKKERSSKKRAFLKASYEEYASTIKSEASTHNQSLASLVSSSSKSSNTTKIPLQYNKGAKRELRKHMSKSHLQEHIDDVNYDLKCHKLIQRACTRTYVKSAEVITRSKLYAILYLALLINKDKIQLGDMIRFIHEGHLSYNSVNHFFPEGFEDKLLNFKSFAKTTELFSHESLRDTALKIAMYINVVQFIPMQNLVSLCERYCQELNLPEQVATFATNLISRTSPKMEITSQTKLIPNYEARAMSFIIFTMKLLFGLDDITENYVSVLSEVINQQLDENMFNFKNWLLFIEYRKLVLNQFHFPTQFVNRTVNIDTFTDFIKESYKKQLVEKEANLQNKLLADLLSKLQTNDDVTRLKFSPTLTPFKDYLALINNSTCVRENGFLEDILIQDFTKTNLDYLLKSKQYSDRLNLNVTYLNQGVNNIEMIPIFKHNDYDSRNEEWMPVALSNAPTKTKYVQQRATMTHVIDTEHTTSLFEAKHREKFALNLRRLEKLCDHNDADESAEKTNYNYYNPDERFWLLTCSNTFKLNKTECNEYLELFPHHFQLIAKECNRVTEQSMRELLEEYNNLELFMCYKFDSESEQCINNTFNKRAFKLILAKYTKLW